MTANRRYTEKRSLVPERLRLIGEGSGHFSGDDGYALVMTALMLIPLTIVTAFAVDLGAWYAQAARTQRAADAASLAGVVWLPTTSLAQQASNASLSRNWFPGQTAPTCGSGATCTVENSVQWKVAVQNNAPRYFSRILALGNFAITRSATAAFNPQIPLGSPLGSFGNVLPPGCTDAQIPLANPAGSCAGWSGTPNLWATINGPYETHANGDPFSTRCWGDGLAANACTNPPTIGGGGAPANPRIPAGNPALNGYYKPDGYLYSVDVKVAGTITVEIYDAAYDARNSNKKETGDNCNNRAACGDQRQNGPTTEFTLYDKNTNAFQTDPTPGNTMKIKNLCSGLDLSGAAATGTLVASPAGWDSTNGGTSTPTVYKNKWTTLCTFNAGVGVYPLRVRVDNIPGVCGNQTDVLSSGGCTGAGQNSFSFRTSGSGSARIYAVDNMDIYNNWATVNGSAGVTNFYLADIQPVHKGKKVVIDLFDVGDVTGGTATLQILEPTGGPYDCNWTRAASQGGAPLSFANNVAGCSIQTSTGTTSVYNDMWLRIVISIPSNYSCTTDCWWRLNYTFGPGATPSDHTTWALNVIGDPVHLVE